MTVLYQNPCYNEVCCKGLHSICEGQISEAKCHYKYTSNNICPCNISMYYCPLLSCNIPIVSMNLQAVVKCGS